MLAKQNTYFLLLLHLLPPDMIFIFLKTLQSIPEIPKKYVYYLRNVITTAIVDCMVHHSIILNIQWPSWRMHESKKLNSQARETKSKT